MDGKRRGRVEHNDLGRVPDAEPCAHVEPGNKERGSKPGERVRADKGKRRHAVDERAEESSARERDVALHQQLVVRRRVEDLDLRADAIHDVADREHGREGARGQRGFLRLGDREHLEEEQPCCVVDGCSAVEV
eukprot:Amastigsp_a341044_12.p4 type:complete len:134 gc:universal Amastigsp_a341044_12:2743-3144(+)